MTTEEQLDLELAVTTLLKGGIILYLTDTVWGLGCDARNDEAVARLFELKRRPDSKAMLLLCSDLDMAAQYVERIPENVRELLRDTERPTTIIYEGAHGISPRLPAADNSIGIRIPDNDFCKEMCRLIGGPLVSTSANFSGKGNCARISEIDKEIIDSVDYVCHSRRKSPTGVPSDIVKVGSDGSLIKIR